jgi:predicted RNA-binding Zn-ribbon protein involved in translation (DUF1610 family)
MSIVEIKCPRCGASAQKSQKPNEYVCSHCGTVFQFVDSSQRFVTTDVRVRNCLFCGKPIAPGKGFKCTRCGQEYFCSSCVDEVGGKYVCLQCIAESGIKCQYCRRYAIYQCVQCGKKACKEHPREGGFLISNGTTSVLYCPNCRSFVCRNCVKYKGFFSTSLHCPKCDATLEKYAPYESRAPEAEAAEGDVKTTQVVKEYYVETPKRSGCFIATAAYGTPFASEIQTLRSFRDSFIVRSSLGKKSILFYYKVSPFIANRIRPSQKLRKIVRTLLVPIVRAFRKLGYK